MDRGEGRKEGRKLRKDCREDIFRKRNEQKKGIIREEQ